MSAHDHFSSCQIVWSVSEAKTYLKLHKMRQIVLWGIRCLTRPFKFNESDVLLGLESKRVRGLHEDGKHVTSNSVQDPHYRPLSCHS